MKNIKTYIINESNTPVEKYINDIIDILMHNKSAEPKELLELTIRSCASRKLTGFGANELKEYAKNILASTTTD